MSEHSTQPQEFFPPPLHTCATYIYVCAKIPMHVCLLLLFFFAWFDRFPTLLIINVPLLEVNPETLLKPRMSVRPNMRGDIDYTLYTCTGHVGDCFCLPAGIFSSRKQLNRCTITRALASASGSSGLNVTDDTNEVYDSLWPRDASSRNLGTTLLPSPVL